MRAAWPWRYGFCLWLGASLVACANIGPRALSEDRLRYTESAAQSLEQQLLLNIVKVRYAESPSFVEVTQIVGSYELTRDLSIGGEYHPNDAADFISPGAALRFSDKPTVTYSPLSGEGFAHTVMWPIPIPAVLALVQSGWAADLVLLQLVRSVNGVNNRVPRLDRPVPENPAFTELARLFRELQDAGAIDVRIQKESSKEPSLFLMLHRPATPALAQELSRLRSLLGLRDDLVEASVTQGLLATRDDQLLIYTYSLLQVLINQAENVDVPAEHLAAGLVAARPPARIPHAMHVHSGDAAPADAAVAVAYKGKWFWVDGADQKSKGVMMGLTIVFRVLESGTGGVTPLLTLPAN